MSETLLRCPFCGVSLKKIGSKRRGNQFYVHDYKGPDCTLKEFSFKADDEEKIKQWNTRKPMQNIVERLKELKDKAVINVTPKNVLAHIDWVEGMDKAIEIVKEEGDLNE